MVYNQLSKIQLARLLGFIAIVFTFLFSLTNESFAETTIVDVTDKELLGEIALVPNSEEDQSAKLTAIIAKYRYNDPEILTFPPGVFILDKDITMRNNISLKGSSEAPTVIKNTTDKRVQWWETTSGWNRNIAITDFFFDGVSINFDFTTDIFIRNNVFYNTRVQMFLRARAGHNTEINGNVFLRGKDSGKYYNTSGRGDQYGGIFVTGIANGTKSYVPMEDTQINDNIFGMKLDELDQFMSIGSPEVNKMLHRLEEAQKYSYVNFDGGTEQNYFSVGMNTLAALWRTELMNNIFYGPYENEDRHGVSSDHMIYTKGVVDMEIAGNYTRGYHVGAAGGFKLRSSRRVDIMNNYFNDTGLILNATQEQGYYDSYGAKGEITNTAVINNIFNMKTRIGAIGIVFDNAIAGGQTEREIRDNVFVENKYIGYRTWGLGDGNPMDLWNTQHQSGFSPQTTAYYKNTRDDRDDFILGVRRWTAEDLAIATKLGENWQQVYTPANYEKLRKIRIPFKDVLLKKKSTIILPQYTAASQVTLADLFTEYTSINVENAELQVLNPEILNNTGKQTLKVGVKLTYRINKGSAEFQQDFIDDMVVAVPIEVTPTTGKMTLSVKDEERQPLAGAVFTLKDKAGKEIKKGLTTNAEGQVELSELAYGEYQLFQTQTAAGYIVTAKPIEVVIDKKETVIEVVNTKERPKTGQVTIQVKDAQNQAVVNAVFKVEDALNNTIKEKITTNEHGAIVLEEIPFGQYRLVQLEAPVGYEMSEDTIFDVNAEKLSIAITNEKKSIIGTGTVILTLTDKMTKAPIEGAVYTLQDDAGTVLQENLKTNGQGQLTVNQLIAGNYQLVETQAAPGYHLEATSLLFEILPNTSEKVLVKHENQAIKKEETTIVGTLNQLPSVELESLTETVKVQAQVTFGSDAVTWEQAKIVYNVNPLFTLSPITITNEKGEDVSKNGVLAHVGNQVSMTFNKQAEEASLKIQSKTVENFAYLVGQTYTMTFSVTPKTPLNETEETSLITEGAIFQAEMHYGLNQLLKAEPTVIKLKDAASELPDDSTNEPGTSESTTPSTTPSTTSDSSSTSESTTPSTTSDSSGTSESTTPSTTSDPSSTSESTTSSTTSDPSSTSESTTRDTSGTSESTTPSTTRDTSSTSENKSPSATSDTSNASEIITPLTKREPSQRENTQHAKENSENSQSLASKKLPKTGTKKSTLVVWTGILFIIIALLTLKKNRKYRV
ncbi:SpaA isopeptide-forming pilin-related protein [Enterococcus faecalis]|uniref:SpaA isopeptide-forming pilin-related protein n=1 Tax=Enterococcus faecalis TaxID=1351 RepID=UPI002457964F|nr:SpaA isopeptide-forming pilin-related protein [Enterococcus faecalis]MDH5040685.1 SpaA isopeptide-forming pilin-related protein [Enterococcus faecalis]